jgi:hypothetical protein
MIGILPCQLGRFIVEPTFMDQYLCDQQSRPPVISSAMPPAFDQVKLSVKGYTGRYNFSPSTRYSSHNLTRITRHLFKYALSVGRHTMVIY